MSNVELPKAVRTRPKAPSTPPPITPLWGHGADSAFRPAAEPPARGRGESPTQSRHWPHFLSARLVVLIAFSVMSATNGFAWFIFATMNNAVRTSFTPYFSAHQISLLGAWQPLTYILLCIPFTVMMDMPGGLRKAMRLAAACEIGGVACKLLSIIMFRHTFAGLCLLHLGQIGSAIGSPVAIGAPSHLSSVWFPRQERTRATAAAVLSNNIGNGISFAVVPLLIMLCTHSLYPMAESEFHSYILANYAAQGNTAAFNSTWKELKKSGVVYDRIESSRHPHHHNHSTLDGVNRTAADGSGHHHKHQSWPGQVVGKVDDAFERLGFETSVTIVTAENRRRQSRAVLGVFLVFFLELLLALMSLFLSFRWCPTDAKATVALPLSPSGTILSADPHLNGTTDDISTNKHNHADKHSKGEPFQVITTSLFSPSKVEDEGDVVVYVEEAVNVASIFKGVDWLVSDRDTALMIVVYAWTSGAFVSWTSLFDDILLSLPQVHLTETFLGFLSLVSCLAYIAGGLVSSVIADVYFPRRMKTIIALCCVGNTFSSALYVWSVPSAERPVDNTTHIVVPHVPAKPTSHAVTIIGAGVVPLVVSSNITPAASQDDPAASVDIAAPWSNISASADHGEDENVDALDENAIEETSPPLLRLYGGGRSTTSGLVHWMRSQHHVRSTQESHKLLAAVAPAPNVTSGAAAADMRDRMSSLKRWLLFASILAGFFNGGSAPLFYESLAEMAFPNVSENISGNVASLAENVGALSFFALSLFFTTKEYLNVAFVMGMAVVTLMLSFVKIAYRRADAHDAETSSSCHSEADLQGVSTTTTTTTNAKPYAALTGVRSYGACDANREQ